MSVTADDIARAAVEAAIAQMEAHGLNDDVRRLGLLLAKAADEKANLVVLTIVTPSGDAGEHARSIARTLEQKLGRPVDIRQKADPSMLGGAIVLFGDERIDLSLRGALEHLESALRTSSSLSL